MGSEHSNQNELISRKWQWLQRLLIAIPSLAVVLVVILYAGFFVSMIFLLVEGKHPVLIILAALVELVVAAWFGAAFFRFGVRLLPLRGDGQRDRQSILILFGALLIVLSLFGFAAWKTGPLIVDGISEPVASEDEEAAYSMAIGRMAETVFVFAGGMSLWAAAAIAAPLVALLVSHLHPLRWREKPHLLFLRRFSGMSNVIGARPMIQGSPSNVQVVLLVGPGTSSRLWNPLMMAFSGARLFNPFRAAPVCLKCSDDTWQSVVRSLAKDATGIVIDLTNDSESMEFEKDVIRALPDPSKVLAVRDRVAPQSTGPSLEIKELPYETGWIGAIPIVIITGFGCFVACQLTAAGLFSLPFIEPLFDYLDETIALAIVWVLSVIFSLFVAWWYSWHPVLKRNSTRQLKKGVQSIFQQTVS